MSRDYDVCVLRRNDFTIDGRVERQAAALGERGLRVLVLAVGGVRLPRLEQRDGYDLERLPIDLATGLGGGIIERAARLPGLGRLGRRAAVATGSAYYYGAAVRRIARARPRVVHCHDLDTLVPGAAGARLTGAALVYDSAELWTERNTGYGPLRARLDRARYTAMEAALIGRADRVVTVSDGIADELQRRYGIRRPVLVRNVPSGAPPEEPSPLREQVGGEGPILLHLGIVDMNRGLEEATRALVELPGVRLVLLGTARPYVMEPLRRLAAELGVSDRLVHLPPVPRDQIIRWASGADAGLCTFLPVCLSHVLALPNKLFEYAFAGVPIVASDLPEMSAFVQRYQAGVLCDPTAPAAIARAVRAVLSGEVPRPNAAAVEALRAELGWERERAVLWQLYDDLGA